MTKPRKNSSDVVASQVRMAHEISHHFQISCTNKTIQNWQKTWTPPFPKGKPDGSYRRKECFKWIETVYLPKVKQAADQPDLFVQKQQAEIRAALRKDRREEIEAGLLEKTIIDRQQARVTMIGILKTYHTLAKKCICNALTPEQSAAIIKAIEDGAAQIGKDAL